MPDATPPVDPTNDPQDQAKDVAFYSAAVQAWIDSRMERDRTLLTLATAGIGLLVTLLTTVGVTQICQFWLYAIAAAGFIATIAICIYVYGANARHIESLLNRASTVATEKRALKQLDTISLCAFLLAAIAFIGIGITSALTKGSPDVRQQPAAETQERTREPPRPGQADSGKPTGAGQAQTPATTDKDAP